VLERAAIPAEERRDPVRERVDRVLTHRVWGVVIFVLLMGAVFQSVFSWAAPAMDAIDALVAGFGVLVEGVMPPGTGALADRRRHHRGSRNTIIFLPQIAVLFFFICVLEDSGYMARAAFIMDRLMGKVGLSGRAFIPLLSSFACAIPGIMATRTIDNRRDRITTIMIAPFMSCSARLPVYALLIGAFIPNRWIGFVTLPALTLFSMYLPRHRGGDRRCVGAQALGAQGRAPAVRDGAAPVPDAVPRARSRSRSGTARCCSCAKPEP
jgi:ferrous iron transport protein B